MSEQDRKTGVVRVARIGGRPRIEQADRFIELSLELVEQIRSFPSEWAWADNDQSITIRDDLATYTYRIVPHSPLTYAGELISRQATAP